MTETIKHSSEDSVPFYPDHVKTEFRVVVGILVVVGIIAGMALLSPVGLEEPADPMNTPAHVKPEWYFLALYQLLKYIPKTAGAVIPVLLALVILILPFLDRKPDRSPQVKRNRLVLVAIGMVVLIALTFWGGLS